MTSTTSALPSHVIPSNTKPADIHISDGRRNSNGEELPSPTATWTPNVTRRQSWNRQDLHRDFTMSELERENKAMGNGGEFVGFTEVVQERVPETIQEKK